jgi:hypothetical protein
LPIRNTSEETCFAQLRSYSPQSKVSVAAEANRKKIPSLGKEYIAIPERFFTTFRMTELSSVTVQQN